jgi:hypothetical protein
MICCCWRAESSVQRPWRTSVTQLRMDGAREVKGAAIEASPGRIMVICIPASASATAVGFS